MNSQSNSVSGSQSAEQQEIEALRQENDALKLERTLRNAAYTVGYRDPKHGFLLGKEHVKWDRKAGRAVSLDGVRSVEQVLRDLTVGREYFLQPTESAQVRIPGHADQRSELMSVTVPK